ATAAASHPDVLATAVEAHPEGSPVWGRRLSNARSTRQLLSKELAFLRTFADSSGEAELAPQHFLCGPLASSEQLGPAGAQVNPPAGPVGRGRSPYSGPGRPTVGRRRETGPGACRRRRASGRCRRRSA